MIKDLESKFEQTRRNKKIEVRSREEVFVTDVDQALNQSQSEKETQEEAMVEEQRGHSLKASYMQVFQNIQNSAVHQSTQKSIIASPTGHFEYTYQYGSAQMKQVQAKRKIRTPSIIVNGIHILSSDSKPNLERMTTLNIQEESFRDYFHIPRQLSLKNSRQNVGPSQLKQNIVIFANKQAIKARMNKEDPRFSIYFERALSKINNKMNLKPRKYLNEESKETLMQQMILNENSTANKSQSVNFNLNFTAQFQDPNINQSSARMQNFSRSPNSYTREPAKKEEFSSRQKQKINLLQRFKEQYIALINETLDGFNPDFEKYLISVKFFENQFRRSLSPPSPTHDQLVNEQQEIDLHKLTNDEDQHKNFLKKRRETKRLVFAETRSPKNKIHTKIQPNNEDSSDNEINLRQQSKRIAFLMEEKQKFENRVDVPLSVESKQIIDYYRVSQKLGGDEYKANLKKLKKDLLNSFFKRIKIELRKFLGIKKESNSYMLQNQKAKMKQIRQMEPEGKITQSQSQLSYQKAFQTLLDPNEEIQKDIQNQEDWDALQTMTTNDLRRGLEPMHQLRQSIPLEKQISPQKLIVSSKYGLDFLGELTKNTKTVYPVQEEVDENHFLNVKPILRVDQLEQQEIFTKERIANQFFSDIRDLLQKNNDASINSTFGQLCLQQNTIAVPIFARINKHQLMLSNYRLNIGLCEALGVYFFQSVRRLNQSYILRKLMLDNNQIPDEAFAAILNGLVPQQQLQSLLYSNNELGHQSLQKLSELLKMQKEPNFNELILKNIKPQIEVTRQLMENVLPNIVRIKTLKLSSINLNDKKVVEGLTAYLQQQLDLEFFDISDTKLLPAQLARITKVIKSHKALLSLNVSLNSMPENKHQPLFIESLGHLLQLKKGKLNHLDLTCLNLGNKAIFQLTPFFSKSISLSSVHLSQNAIETSGKLFLMQSLAIPQSQLQKIETNQVLWLSEVQKTLENKYNTDLKVRTIVQAQLSKQTIAKSNFVATDGVGVGSTVNDVFVLTRWQYNSELEFFEEQKMGLMRWQVAQGELKKGQSLFGTGIQIDKCYICNNWRYVVLFFKKENTFFTQIKNQTLIDKINQNTGTLTNKTPDLFGSFTTLPQLKMVPLREFISKLKQRLPEYVKNTSQTIVAQKITQTVGTALLKQVSMRSKKLLSLTQKIGKKLANSELPTPGQQISDNESESETLSEHDYKTEQIFSISTILNKLKAVEPEALVLNYDQILDTAMSLKSTQVSDCYVFAGYVRPGKHFIIVKDQSTIWFKSLLIEARQSLTVAPKYRKYKLKPKDEIFSDNSNIFFNSVFRDWRVEVREEIEKYFEEIICLEGAFKIITAETLSVCKKIFKENFMQVISFFFELLSQNEFGAKLLDLKDFTTLLIQYKAKGVLKIEKECREYVEASIGSVANYLEKGQLSESVLSPGEYDKVNFSEGTIRVDLNGLMLTLIKLCAIKNKVDVVKQLQQLLDKDIPDFQTKLTSLSYLPNLQIISDPKVNLVITKFTSNLVLAFNHIVKKPMNLFFYNQCYLIQNCLPVNAFRQLTKIQVPMSADDSIVTIKLVQTCFFKSKSDYKWTTLTYVEFLLFLCKIADCLFQQVKINAKLFNDTKNKPLATKVALVLNILLPRILYDSGLDYEGIQFEDLMAQLN